MKPRVLDWYAAALGMGLLLTGMWAHLDQLPGASLLGGLALLLLALFVAKDTASASQKNEKPINKKYKSSGEEKESYVSWKSYLAFCLALISPIIAFWTLTWTWEFPFSGDHDHHLAAVYQAARFWRGEFLWVLIVTGFISIGLFKIKSYWWPLALVGLLYFSSFFAEIPPHYFVRYPASNYFLGGFLFTLGEYFNWADLINSVRLNSSLALLFWVLMRFWIFKRPNHFGFYIAAIVFVWQKYHVYYFASAYLEPWSAVFLLLAVESACSEKVPLWYSALFAGCALFFKETVAFLWPFIILAGLIRQPTVKKKWEHLALAGLAALPFLIYLLARQQAEVWRKFELVSLAEAFNQSRIENFWFRIVEQYHPAGLTALLILVFTGLYFSIKNREMRLPVLVLFFGAGLQIFIFFIDKISQEATAYPRFHMLPLILLLAPVFAGFRNVSPRLGLVALAISVLGQGPALFQFFKLFNRPAYTHSFSEGYSVPIHLPIRYLTRKAEAEDLLREGQTIHLVPPSEKTRFNIFPLVYRDLQNYRWVTQPDTNHYCRCKQGQAYLIPFPRPMNLYTLFPNQPYEEKINRISEACVQSVKASCDKCVSAEWAGSESLGWLCLKK